MSEIPPIIDAVDTAISPLNKGIGFVNEAIQPDQIAMLDWNLLREDLSLPCAVLYEDKLQHNLTWMQRFAATYGVSLAPHGKTTMAPQLFARQLRAGAWGITLATAHQTRIAYEHGVRRVLMANQLIGKGNMTIIAHLLRDPDFEYFCLVDSAEQVEQLGAFFAGTGCRLNVLLELGVAGGRSGVRDDWQLQAVLNALSHLQSQSLSFRGVEMYEGVLDNEEAVRTLLTRTVAVVRQLADRQCFTRSPILLSGAGSAWYDIVAEVFSEAGFGDSLEVVLRPGCYLTHDTGLYRKAQEKILQRNPIAREMNAGLLPALQVWAYVQSIPEPHLAIVGLGKRDAAFDAGLPVPALHYRPGGTAPTAANHQWNVTQMMDQHAYLRVAPGDDLRIGDMIGFGISHPCLTFDKWRTLPILDTGYQVIDIIQTFF